MTHRSNIQRPRRSWTRAFTLIEVIVTLLLAGTLTSLMLPLLGSALSEGSRPVQRLQKAYDLRTHMDEWVYRYRTQPANYGNNLPNLLAAIQQDEQLFGGYDLVSHAWVNFDLNGNEVPGGADALLHIVLGNDAGNHLAFVFSPLDPLPFSPPSEIP